MVRAKGFYTRLTLEAGKFTKAADKIMEVEMKRAAGEWLRAVLVKVPVWTGMSQGSFKPLAAYIRYKFDIVPVVTRKGMSPDIGAQQSTFVFEKVNNVYSFRFTEKVAHYTINEFYNANVTGDPEQPSGLHLITPGPYLSFNAGELAFQAYMSKVLPERLPKIEDFVDTSRIAYFGNQHTK